MLRQYLPQILMTATVAMAGIGFAARAAMADETSVSGPFVHDNLAVYFLHGPSAPGPVPLTLDEALEQGAVKVVETGTVAELRVENTGADDVLIHAGDIVKGGQQDRVVTTTFILKPKSGPVPLAVFCVESGRWAARGVEDVQHFASSKEMMPSREAKMALKVSALGAAHRQGAETADVSAGIESEPNVTASVRSDNANEPVQRQSAAAGARSPNLQGEIWSRVGEIQDKLSKTVGGKVNAAASETSLQLALENEELAKAQQEYIDALKGKAEAGNDVIGYVFAVNGRINSADLYGSNAVFRKVWPKLLKASATEALGSRDDVKKDSAPSTADVQAFLKSADASEEEKRAPIPGVVLKARSSKAAYDTATEAADGRLLHRNVLAY